MANKDQFKQTLEQLRKSSKKRKFNQAIDLIINFKNLDLKKNPVDHFITLPNGLSKGNKICVAVDDDFVKANQGKVDRVIGKSELERLNNNKDIKKIGREFNFFISQANLMGLIATKFGRILGPLGKMPNPKYGGVVAPGADIKNVVSKFRKSIKVSCKNELIIKTKVGYEDMKDEEITDNSAYVYDTILHSLPQGEHNVKSVILKLTMGNPLIVGEKKEEAPLENETTKKKTSIKKPVSEKESFEKKASQKKLHKKKEKSVKNNE